MEATHIIVGGGSAGSTLAARLSEVSANKVVLIEAGNDYPPSQTPDDILDSYAGRATANGNYFWSKLRARRVSGDNLPDRIRLPTYYEQARVIGGGSSINGQVALRGVPDDYDRWHRSGATGWDWNSVLPYFRKLEEDIDFVDQLHGSNGPIGVRRVGRENWDGFTLAVTDAWESRGHSFVGDMNGVFEDGYAPLPTSTVDGKRVSAAIGYLNDDVRRRPNLTILANTRAHKLTFEGSRATGVEVADETGVRTISGKTIIVSSGAIHSPWLLMVSGIGPAEHLRSKGVSVVADRPGVGAHLLEHPSVSIASYMSPAVRQKNPIRRNYVYLRYSSGLEDCGQGDMMSMAISRTAWHAVGVRLCSLSTYVSKAFSEGSVRLATPSQDDEPDVDLNLLSDQRDRVRLMDAFRRMAGIFTSSQVENVVSNPFAASYSDRVRRAAQMNLKNAATMGVVGALLDSSPLVRRLLIDNAISDGPRLSVLLSDDAALEHYVCSAVKTAWHPCGTCRMGRNDDPTAVVDPSGRVIGTDNLFVCDASIMPEIPRGNLNIPVIMIAERMSDLLKELQ